MIENILTVLFIYNSLFAYDPFGALLLAYCSSLICLGVMPPDLTKR